LKIVRKFTAIIFQEFVKTIYSIGIRGGLVQASMRHAKANNHKLPDYDQTKPNSWLVYQDCKYINIFFFVLLKYYFILGNNLYGWAMSQYMPFGGFKWVEPKLDGLNDLDETSHIGRMYEVDVRYPVELHDQHNDFPFLPQNGKPAGSKVKKLMATFKSKKNYVLHYRNLQQAIKNGLIVEKVNFFFFFLIYYRYMSYTIQSVGMVSRIY